MRNFEFPEGFGHGRDHRLNGDLAFFDFALGLFGLGGERGFREVEKLLGG
jgi:hypothetical protein